MGQDVVIESDDCFQERSRPKNVCPSIISTNVEDRDCNSKLDARYRNLNSFVGEPRVLSRHHCSSLNSKSMPSEIFEDARDTDLLQRGSMYLSSKEARRIKKDREERRKVESACSPKAYISFELVNSSPHLRSNETVLLQRHSPPASSDSDTNSSILPIEFPDLSFRDLNNNHLNKLISSSGLVSVERNLADDISEICLCADGNISHKTAVPEMLKAGTSKEQEPECDQKCKCESTRRTIYDRNTSYVVPKSYLTKIGISTVRSQLKNSLINANLTTTSFRPIKKMFGPITMSKSRRNSLLVGSETTGSAYTDAASVRKKRLPLKSVVNDNSMASSKMKSNALIGEQVLTYFSLPGHLHGILKLETSSGNPSFSFLVKDTEDILSAKTWRTDNVFNWVYTFHSSGKRNQSTCKRSIDKNGHSPPIVGQMPVSCYLCSEIQDNGSIVNSIITEFILYDILQGRWSLASEENSTCSSDTSCPLQINSMEKLVTDGTLTNSMECQLPTRHAFDSHNSDVSTSYPWLPEDLHPDLEIASVVVQTPFRRKEKSKNFKDETRPREWTELSSYPGVHLEGETTNSSLNSTIVKVITPSEKHGLPNLGAEGPSTLLNRWRYGGCCDCGGWDMGCPLHVFENTCADYWADNSSSHSGKPILLFGQGSKETMPALSIMADGQGQYLVDFHARFSPLQAFSISIAILHGSEASTTLTQEKSRPMLYSNSLKLLLEEEVRRMIEELAVEEKPKVPNVVEQGPASLFLDPPFSPVARV